MKSLRLFLACLTVAGVLFTINGSAFSQWPGEETSTTATDTSEWPDDYTLETIKDYIPPNAENFICTFEYSRNLHTFDGLEMGRHGKPICPSPSSGSSYGNYFSGDLRTALENLIDSAGVRSDRIIAMEMANFQNAAALLCEDQQGEVKQLVLWDSAFLAELDDMAGTRWASVAVLAHELAHHLNNDTGQNPGMIPPHERQEQELYADRYAGQKLREFGVSRGEAVAVFNHMGEGGDSHPPSRQRVAAAGEGWDRGRNGSETDPTESGGGTVTSPQVRMATVCQTGYGFCLWHSALPRLPVGSQCVCYTGLGTIPGIAQ